MVWLVKSLCKIIFGLLLRVELVNKEYVPEKGSALVCSNHPGTWDMFLIGYKLKRLTRYMAKEELFKNPILKFVLTRVGAFPVKRGKADVESMKTAINLLKEGHIVAVFPEGTRTRDKRISAGGGAALMAIRSGAPVVPVRIKGEYKLFGKIKVIFGEPFYIEGDKDAIYPSSYLKQKSNEIMDRVFALD
ncbi:MAG TPA: 1-acyl-sn-glycerol-3-phosphate acyltransferase [Clostridiaceae bacterium]|jgi:1-acyl-sn-glycerol-3-phosphate acyltransferase|nr:1-acyl-sn-glycerol-3-phosphate acyltransferase [Clostridiaceae bacterium]